MILFVVPFVMLQKAPIGMSNCAHEVVSRTLTAAEYLLTLPIPTVALMAPDITLALKDNYRER